MANSVITSFQLEKGSKKFFLHILQDLKKSLLVYSEYFKFRFFLSLHVPVFLLSQRHL